MNKALQSVLAIVVLAALVWFGYDSWHSHQPDTRARKMVYLADGQIYFGYASSFRNRTVTMTEIYYLQQPQAPQTTDKNAAPQPLNLIKLGSEFYGPKDKMEINRDRITFVEEINDDSQVSKEIQKFKSK